VLLQWLEHGLIAATMGKFHNDLAIRKNEATPGRARSSSVEIMIETSD
jgi:hypothetical protein